MTFLLSSNRTSYHVELSQFNGTEMKKGFTLIEVTVALAIFAIASVALTQSFLGGMFSLETFKFDDRKEDSLMFVYAKVMAHKERKDLEKGGTIDTIESGTAKWSAKVQKTSVLELYKVDVTVVFDDEKFANKASHKEEFYVYRPKWAEPGERDEFIQKNKKEPTV